MHISGTGNRRGVEQEAGLLHPSAFVPEAGRARCLWGEHQG